MRRPGKEDGLSIGQRCFNNWPIDSPPSYPGLHDLRIACLNTYYNMKAISLHYNITDQLSD